MSDLQNIPFFLVNPKARGGRGHSVWQTLLPKLEQYWSRFECVFSKSPDDLRVQVNLALDQGHRWLIAVGGDGTLNTVANAVLGRHPNLVAKTVLGHLPLGSGEDFKRSLNWPAKNPLAALERLQKKQTRLIDLIEVRYQNFDKRAEKRFCLNAADFGLGGQVMMEVNRSSKLFGATFTYLFHVLKAVVAQPSFSFVIESRAQKRVFEDVLIGVIANGKFLGSGLCVAPEADLSDGVFNTVLLKKSGVFAFLKLLPALYQGASIVTEDATVFTADLVRVLPQGGQSIPLEMDGESVGFLPATFKIRPRALTICV